MLGFLGRWIYHCSSHIAVTNDIEGIFHPKVATGSTLIWVFGRIFYTIQYGTGKPEVRVRFQMLSLQIKGAHKPPQTKGLAPISYIGLSGKSLHFGPSEEIRDIG